MLQNKCHKYFCFSSLPDKEVEVPVIVNIKVDLKEWARRVQSLKSVLESLGAQVCQEK